MLRAREPKMLTYDRAVAMTEASGLEEAAKQISEFGYPDMAQMDAAGIEQTLSEHRDAIFGELVRLTPDEGLIGAFRMKYDYHNVKTIIKAEAAGLDGSRLLSGMGRFDAERLTADYNEDKLTDYPETFSTAVREAAGILAKTGNPQLSDFVLDKAYFAELLADAEELGNDYFLGYVKLLIDSANFRSAVRTLRMGKDSDFLKDALIPGGSVACEKVEAAASASDLAALYASGPLSGAALLAENAVDGASLTDFEKACDNAVNNYLKKARYVTYGPETVIAYLASVEAETTAARMILTGKLSGVEGSIIKERLRDMYA